MSNNIFSGSRFLKLFQQHFIHNNKLLLYATVAYVGVVFIILSITQMGENLRPHDLEYFRGFLLGFVGVFGVLYVGYSFPAFRSKESSINYLLVPGSVLEKFLFELVSRIGIMLILLPVLYWITFNFQGYFFTLFTDYGYSPIGISYLTEFEVPDIEADNIPWFLTLIVSAVMLGFVLPFTGAAMFSKQPLIKTLFSIAIIIMMYVSIIYIIVEHLGMEYYAPSQSTWIFPRHEGAVFPFFTVFLIVANAIMLFVAYRKVKEKEV